MYLGLDNCFEHFLFQSECKPICNKPYLDEKNLKFVLNCPPYEFFTIKTNRVRKEKENSAKPTTVNLLKQLKIFTPFSSYLKLFQFKKIKYD